MLAGRRLRRINRYRKIAMALVSNGFGHLVQQLGLFEWMPSLRRELHKERDASSKSLGERLRSILEHLGPTFIKMGQLASTRPDLIPPHIIKELEKLQDDVPPFPYEEAVKIIERELGEPIDQLFAGFERVPMASASIGQVYRAELHDGTKVAVKVQRPNIEKTIETDLEIIADWVRLAEARLEWARRYRLREIVEELSRALRQEIDYTAEARNGEKFVYQSKSWEHVHVPQIYWDYSTKRVLTTQYYEGIPLSDMAAIDRAGYDRKLIAERLTTTILQQILMEGFFHGDPHPGNILVMANQDLVLLDFGMVGRLTPSMKKYFSQFVIGLRNQSTKGVIRAITNMGVVPDDVNREQLYADIDELREKYYKVPFSSIRLSVAVQDMFNVAYRHQISVPVELTMLGKALLTLEGVVSMLDPNFSVFDVAEPFGKRLVKEQFSPKRLARSWLEDLPEYVDMIYDIPMSVKQLMTLIRKGQIRIELSAPQADQIMKRLDRISNRLTFSVIILSLSIVMVGIVVGMSLSDSDVFLWRFPVIEIGFIVVLLLFTWLILSIFRSGRF